jgi:hypothetical protein
VFWDFKGRRFKLLQIVKQVRFKVLAVIMAVMLALPAVPLAFAAPDGTAEIFVGAPLESIPADGLRTGDVITIPVMIDDNSGFATAGISAYFDTNVFEYVSSSLSRRAPSILSSTDFILVVLLPDAAAEGKLMVTAAYDPEYGNCTDNGRLFSFQLRVKQGAPAGNSTISVGIVENNPANFVKVNPSGGEEGIPVQVNFTPRSILIANDTPEPTEATIDVADITAPAAVGSTVTLPVTIANNPGFTSARLKVNYNSAELRLVSVTQGAITQTPVYFEANASTGEIFIFGISDIVANGELFSLAFEVVGVPSSGAAFVSLQTFGGNPLNFTNAAGTPVQIDYLTGSVAIETTGTPINVPSDLNMPAFDSGTTWNRTYNGSPQGIAIGLRVGGGTGSVTVYYNGSATVPTNAGSYAVTITTSGVVGFINITTQTDVGTLNIAKAAAPVINWPTASAITYGQTISSIVLNPTSNAYGTFAWDSSVNLSEIPAAGNQSYPVVFAPSAETLTNYEAIAVLVNNVSVVVNKAAAPVISWPTASVIRQGQALSAVTLSFNSNEFGTFAWANASTIPVAPGGNFTLVFVPSASTIANYDPIAVTQQDVSVTVIRPGDVDGDHEITALDVMRIMQHAAGVYTLTGNALIAADVDGNGTITTADAVLAARIAIGLEVAP